MEWAGQFWDEVLPNIRSTFTSDGKLWALPWDIELFCRVYMKQDWDELGETPAETLEEFDEKKKSQKT